MKKNERNESSCCTCIKSESGSRECSSCFGSGERRFNWSGKNSPNQVILVLKGTKILRYQIIMVRHLFKMRMRKTKARIMKRNPKQTEHRRMLQILKTAVRTAVIMTEMKENLQRIRSLLRSRSPFCPIVSICRQRDGITGPIMNTPAR